MTLDHGILYALAGVALGAIGTLVGAGGGFILMPMLLLVFPEGDPEKLTAVSLAVVFFNALSGSIAYLRQGRVQVRAALLFALAALPGAFIGVWVNGLVPRRVFDLILGGSLLVGSTYLLYRSRKATPATHEHHPASPQPKMALGLVISAGVGFLSSLLGIGGGIVHVPALIYVLGFPAHSATATSHLVLALTAFVATIVHFVDGDFSGYEGVTIALSVGVVVGAQVGASLSKRVHGAWIVRALAIALLAVGVRVLSRGFQ